MNGFLKALKGAEKDKFDPDAVYGDFMKYHSEFIAIYEELKRYAEGLESALRCYGSNHDRP